MHTYVVQLLLGRGVVWTVRTVYVHFSSAYPIPMMIEPPTKARVQLRAPPAMTSLWWRGDLHEEPVSNGYLRSIPI